MKVLVLDENDLGQKVLAHYKEEDLVPYKFSKFKDGEILVELLAPVTNEDVMLVATISDPVNDNLVKVLICVDALRRSSAKTINLIVPYLGYSRQDRRVAPWQPITAKLMADLLQTAGVSRVITCDLHAKQIEGFYHIPIDNIPVMMILGNRWKKKVGKDINLQDFAVVSPDNGGVTRAKEFMNQAKIPTLIVVNKYREKANEVAATQIIGNVENKNVIIIDDMVDTGGTLLKVSSELKKLGAKDIYIYCTHGLLSGDAIEKISNSPDIKNLIVTNSIDRKSQLINDKIIYVDISDIITGIIDSFDNQQYLYNYLMSLLEE